MSRPLPAAALVLLIFASDAVSAAARHPVHRPVPKAVAATPAAEVPGSPAQYAAAKAIDTQEFMAKPDAAAQRRILIRAQVLLDRAHFSPGVIDGKPGGNMVLALRGFQAANGLTVDGSLGRDTWDRLVAGDAAPVVRVYALAAEDVAGPFAAAVEPGDYVTMAARPNMTWTSALEGLAEHAHMDEALVQALNPGAKFDKAGATILVAAVKRTMLPAVTRIEVDKTAQALRAFDGAGKLVAVYPATVGSAERPAPDGDWAVRTVATAATYTFDPARLTFKAKGDTAAAPVGKLTIKPGPNNPVGTTWIDLTKDTYGIHGSPDPRLVGKRASHGCVRLTNWDAQELAKAVKAGAKVSFVGAETRATT